MVGVLHVPTCCREARFCVCHRPVPGDDSNLAQQSKDSARQRTGPNIDLYSSVKWAALASGFYGNRNLFDLHVKVN